MPVQFCTMLFEYCVLTCELFLLKTVKILQTAIAECFWPFFFLFLPKIKSCHLKLWTNLGFIFSSQGVFVFAQSGDLPEHLP